ncbi:hypothetical protein [Streptomyces sp. A5-4]|uniref:hypothetical protein n=1 Tax=Streptomyces sp. A5-4 TaxID=3384771 RepID=UPI003DA83D62
MERIALTFDQVTRYTLVPAVGKSTDPRRPAFARRHDLDPTHPVQWEVEALDAAELRRLVLAAVTPFVDVGVLAEQLAEEDRQRRQLRDLVEDWQRRQGPPG